MKYIIYILFFLQLFACNEAKNHKEKYTLRIAINTNYSKYLLNPSISKKQEDSVYYDSMQNLIIFKYDNLKKGQVKISFEMDSLNKIL